MSIHFQVGYLFANEWATSASNSRLFRIFLPLDRSGTLTESIAYNGLYFMVSRSSICWEIYQLELCFLFSQTTDLK